MHAKMQKNAGKSQGPSNKSQTIAKDQEPKLKQIPRTRWGSTLSEDPNTKQTPSTEEPQPQIVTARLFLVWNVVLEICCLLDIWFLRFAFSSLVVEIWFLSATWFLRFGSCLKFGS
jgi:hypothetical protein